MGKRIVKVMSVLQIILAIVAYFSLSIHFENDGELFGLLANTDFLATILRLSIYMVPGIHLLSGLYGLVFSDKKILLLITIFELTSCILAFTYIGSSEYMLILSIVGVSISALYLLGVLLIKNK